MKFGDILVSEDASRDNPDRTLMFCMNEGGLTYCLSLDGERVVFDTRYISSLKKVGAISLRHWKDIAHLEARGAIY